MPPATIAARGGVILRRGATIATVSLLGLAAAATAASATEASAGQTYGVEFEGERVEERLVDDAVTVEPGDTLSLIAVDVGLDQASGWRVLFDANDHIEDPDLIVPGQEVEVPEQGEELQRRELAAPPATGGGADTGGAEQAEEPAAEEPAAEEPAASEAPAEEPAPAPAESEATASGSVWDRLAQCESNGDWSINTGNGYYGGLQFHPDTWAGHGGHEYAPNAHQATREQEIVIAERVLQSQGWGAWPACSSQLGLR